jgi:murein DD-endopeptidase MepM/ murein hydrolase activator NlpD
MSSARVAVVLAVATVALLCCAPVASALTNVPGGVQAPASAPPATITPTPAPGVPVHTATQARPSVASLSVPKTASAGRPPRVSLRIDEMGVASVYAQVTITALATRKVVVVSSLGWVRIGRTIVVSWPSAATLAPGSYELSVSAHDRRGNGLLRGAHSSGVASLTVTASTPVPAKAPAPTAVATPVSSASLEAGVPTPAQTVADGAVFPVAGPHNFGGPENVFGAPRDGYLHQGQDVLTTEGTPVVVPLAGTILTTSYQEGGAGYYAVEETQIAFDFMFAHCQASSLVVSAGETVAAGQALCRAGQTGDATAPHLDFEIWVAAGRSPAVIRSTRWRTWKPGKGRARSSSGTAEAPSRRTAEPVASSGPRIGAAAR